MMTAEHKRLEEYRAKTSNWKLWGPYVSDRAWGTVREDYSEWGNAWEYFPHDHARSRIYRWGEDGIGGISDRNQYLCFGLAFWNGKDPILKERFFGVTPHEGNHGEDVKEYYFYTESTPTHSYMRMTYKYPQRIYPYAELVEGSRRRSRKDPELELVETGVFDSRRYFDCVIEYAKANTDDIHIRISITNHAPEEAPILVLPTLWFRNTWSWGYEKGPMGDVANVPLLKALEGTSGYEGVEAAHDVLGKYFWYAKDSQGLLFTENETNAQRLFGKTNKTAYVKDAFHRYFIDKEQGAVNLRAHGTKACAVYQLSVPSGETKVLSLRLAGAEDKNPFQSFDAVFAARQKETEEFYSAVQSPKLSADEKLVQRQAFAGMLWSKQLYYYDLEQWTKGDSVHQGLPSTRAGGRNRDWSHLANFDIISMPDKWEFPWYAAWDLAFHAIVLAMVDGDFAKRQLELMTREWYMHPNGQLPAYEWAFQDVNPPVHAWATWRVYKIDAKLTGKKDRAFLEGVFHKLLLNFTWWVNRKDAEGRNIFQGGFLGLDNIGVFDRSAPLPTGGTLDQADGTSWMAAYCLWMLQISLELADENPVYQDCASKFLEHFLRVAHAMADMGSLGHGLWDEQDGFFYDVLHLPDKTSIPLRVRSLVGLIPLLAVDTIEPNVLERMPDFHRRLKWFVTNRQHLSGNLAQLDVPGTGKRRLTAILTKERLVRVLRRMFDENEFLSEYGIRSMSRFHEANPFKMKVGTQEYTVAYEPSESTNDYFGGNSNWRGPVWFPMNYLFIEALQKFHHYYGDDLLVEYPTGSGKRMNLKDIAADLSRRLSHCFLKNDKGLRPFFGDEKIFQSDPHWKDLIWFNEYFNPDSGQGCGASHQTGWTGLVAKLLQQSGGNLDGE